MSEPTPVREALRGSKDISPVILGVLPFGVVYGLAAIGSGLPESAALALSAAVFAGAAQMAGVQLMGQGASIVIVLLTTFIVNLRYLMYSASVAPHFKDLPLSWKVPLGFFMSDQAYAFSVTRYAQNPDMRYKHWYYLGSAFTLYPVWLLSSAAGIFLGAQVPASWGLEFSIPLVFLALVFPSITDKPSALAGLIGAVVAVVAYPLPYNLNLILAALCGITAGVVAENRLVEA